VATNIGTRDVAVADSADGTRTPCKGRLLQAQQANAKISTRAGPKKSAVFLNFTGSPPTRWIVSLLRARGQFRYDLPNLSSRGHGFGRHGCRAQASPRESLRLAWASPPFQSVSSCRSPVSGQRSLSPIKVSIHAPSIILRRSPCDEHRFSKNSAYGARVRRIFLAKSDR
jgi:hypothetical protein